MNRREAVSIHINSCIDDEELARIEGSAEAAQSGAWYMRNARVERNDGTPVDHPASLAFMAEARAYVPRLIRGLRVLEEALRLAWAKNIGEKAENARQKAHYQAALERSGRGETGPESDIALLVECRKCGIVNDVMLATYLRCWALGEAAPELLHTWLAEAHRREYSLKPHAEGGETAQCAETAMACAARRKEAA